MHVKLSLIWVLVGCLLAITVGTVLAQVSSYVLPGDKVFPEGIAYQPSTGDFFVGSTTDGSVRRGNVARTETQVFIPGGTGGMTTAVGMKVDGKGRLIVCAGGTGRVFVFDAATGNPISSFGYGVTPTFCNDVTVTPDGKAYLTDSQSPFIYRLGEMSDGTLTLEKWLDVSPGIPYQTGFNINGIASTGDGKYLIVAQSNVGKYFRIDVANKEMREINLGGADVRNTDGMWLEGQTLWAVRNSNRLIVTFRMSPDFSSGLQVSVITDPSLRYPTTLAKAGDRLLIVNSQFDRRAEVPPDLPFTIASIPVSVTIGGATPAVTAASGMTAPLPRTGGGLAEMLAALTGGLALISVGALVGAHSWRRRR